ncbi:MAG: condensation domain-containing protein, partial [Kofleriaceae bacterium]
LAELLQRDDGVDVVKLTPSHIDALRAHTGDAVRAGGARTFVIGGEQLLGEHVAWCQRVAPRARVINEYGPTETVVGCCVHEIGPGDAAPDIVPIGQPIDHTELYVLSPWLQPVPVGVPGELYIGGAGVAHGYHRRPELTAEKFVDHPFAARPGARLYRTGDRVVWSADGRLTFLGRVDDQVKVRGFRIELGEIDAQLARHPAVREAVTVVRDAANGRPQLVSYVVGAASGDRAELTTDVLRKDLSARLPDHMVPGVIVFLSQLPLTPNGKIDRGALPSPAAAKPGGELPATELEHELAALWSELLGRDDVRRDDNFFELGGDSILGIQLVARAHERGIQLSPRQLFENQTLARLAGVARRAAPDSVVSQGPVIGPVALAPIQRWFFDEHPVEPHHFNQSILLEVPPGVDAAALGRALDQLVAHHDLLRARFLVDADGVRADIAPPGPIELVVTDLSHQPPAEQSARLSALIAEDQASLRLDGSLLLPHLFRLGARPGRLLLTTHHLIVDGVSWRILVEDLLRAYHADAGEGTVAALPAKTASFDTWVERLTAWAGSPEAAAETARWTAVPDGPAVTLPLDHPYTADDNRAGYTAELTRRLPVAETTTLRDSARATYNVNVQELLLAALTLALPAPGAHGAIAVDVEGHGREDLFDGIDISRTVGWFTSMFAIHLPVRADRDPAAALTAIKELVRAVPHAGLGFGVLRYLSPDPTVRAALAAAPVPQLRFNYFGQLDSGPPPAPGFALATEPCEPLRSPLGPRRHLLDLNAWIRDGELAMTWTYSQRLFEAATVEALADRVVAALAELAQSCAGTASRHYTPSDFPDVEMSQDNLDHLLADISFANQED